MTNIEPIQVPRSITGFVTRLLRLNLFVNAEFVVDSCDETGTIVKTDHFALTPEEYQQWNSDDNFIVNLVAERLGYIIKPPEPVVEPVVEPIVEPVVEPI